MKIYISADFEGVAGIVDRHQCFPGSPDFERARRHWVEEINAVVEGALEAGASEIVVNEAHAAMNYMLPELLHPEASFISGYVKPDNQMEGIDPSFAGAVILGHARAGTAGAVLNHSYVMRDVVGMRLNGDEIGEFGLNAYWAAYYGVPTVLVVGDDKFAQEAQELIPEIETAVVKRGISQFTAHSLPLESARGVIREASKRAVSKAGDMLPPKLADHFSLEIDFSLSEIAHLCSYIPGVERVAARTVKFTSPDYRQVMQVRIVCTNLALGVVRGHF
jgi:D-amino peptidase